MRQDILRREVKLAKAMNEDIYFKDFASYLNMTEHAFYNWLHGYYDLSSGNAMKLHDVVIDLID